MIETEITLNLPSGPIRAWVHPREHKIIRLAACDGTEWGAPQWHRAFEAVDAGLLTFHCDPNCYGHTEFFLKT